MEAWKRAGVVSDVKKLEATIRMVVAAAPPPIPTTTRLYLATLVILFLTAYLVYAWRRREVWLISMKVYKLKRDVHPYRYWYVMLLYWLADALFVYMVLASWQRLH